jgi:hypothetical protein
MSMSQDSQDFGQLRRLLALKRHEQPPPGYFNDFSSQVIARIKAGDRAEEGALGRLLWDAPWLQRFWSALEAKPIVAGAFGAAVCALLVGGVLYSERVDIQPIVAGPDVATPALVQFANVSASDEPIMVQSASMTLADKMATPGSLGAAPSAAGLFDLVPKPKAEPAAQTLKLSLPTGN